MFPPLEAALFCIFSEISGHSGCCPLYGAEIILISSPKKHTPISVQPQTQKHTIPVINRDVKILYKIVVDSMLKEQFRDLLLPRVCHLSYQENIPAIFN